jgi:hypothetical protein
MRQTAAAVCFFSFEETGSLTQQNASILVNNKRCKTMKKISLLLLMAISIFVIYQFQKPILTDNNATIKAKEYVKVINEKKNADFDTEKPADYLCT